MKYFSVFFTDLGLIKKTRRNTMLRVTSRRCTKSYITREYSTTSNKTSVISNITRLGKTFGELENETKSSSSTNDESPSTLTKMKENSMYKSFFQDFEKLKKSVENSNERITSFEEQKSFKQVFDYLSKESNKVGMVKSLESFVNMKSPVQKNKLDNFTISTKSSNTSKKSFFSVDVNPINLEQQFKLKSENYKLLIQALLPTLSYINSNIKTTQQFREFVEDKIIQKFLDNVNFNEKKKSKKPRKKSIQVKIDDIKSQSLLDPENPVIDIQTLPILLKFCLNSITFDFNSISTSFLLIDFIKNHKSIELYGYGLNIDVYNSLINQVWLKTQNLSLVISLIDELKVNAIQPDLFTYKILSKIYLHCMRVSDSINAEPFIIWNQSNYVYKIRDYLNEFRFL